MDVILLTLLILHTLILHVNMVTMFKELKSMRAYTNSTIPTGNIFLEIHVARSTVTARGKEKTATFTLKTAAAHFVSVYPSGISIGSVTARVRAFSLLNSAKRHWCRRKIARALIKAERAPQIELGENDKYLRARDVVAQTSKQKRHRRRLRLNEYTRFRGVKQARSPSSGGRRRLENYVCVHRSYLLYHKADYAARRQSNRGAV
jgi:hypothetical protein